MGFQLHVSRRLRIENMVVEIRDYEIEEDEEFVLESSRLRISSALDLSASARNPVALWQLPTNNEWIPQRQVAVFPPDTPVRVRIPKGVHRTLGCVFDQKVTTQMSPIALADTLRADHEGLHQVSTLLSRELEENQLAKPQMIAGLCKLFTRYVGRQLNNAKPDSSHALITWRMRIIQEAVNRATMGENLDLDELAARCRISRQYLLSQFRRATGISLGDQLWSARADRAKRLIEEGHTFSSIADQLNYSGLSHFSLRFSRSTGVSPSKYRQQIGLQDN